jgi:hypothetical protein
MKKLLSKSFWKNNLFLSKHKMYIGKNFSQSITMGNTVIEVMNFYKFSLMKN